MGMGGDNNAMMIDYKKVSMWKGPGYNHRGVFKKNKKIYWCKMGFFSFQIFVFAISIGRAFLWWLSALFKGMD